jgi:choline dehydrogenase-like flavoprotein
MPDKSEDYGLESGGRIIHEAGCTRMGKDPKLSVLNEWCQAHEAKNVVVCDAGPFVTNADKNCTWTIMALAWRTAEHLADEVKKGNV